MQSRCHANRRLRHFITHRITESAGHAGSSAERAGGCRAGTSAPRVLPDCPSHLRITGRGEHAIQDPSTEPARDRHSAPAAGSPSKQRRSILSRYFTGESVKITKRSNRVTVSLRARMTKLEFRGLNAVTALLVLLFCLSSTASAPAAETGCAQSDSSVRICGQSRLADPVPAIVPQVFPAQWGRAVTASLPWLSAPSLASQFHPGPSSPRAPPASLV